MILFFEPGINAAIRQLLRRTLVLYQLTQQGAAGLKNDTSLAYGGNAQDISIADNQRMLQ